ncbi:hypothetical protein BGZ60DRAFT_187634 [Tricladium varicosporioides]|nr:hypothetical protein BGZ60DRAFT_187634 [Hymenoscyphus varicosporioides]
MGTFRSLFGRSKHTNNTTTKSKISHPIPIDAGLQSQSYDSAVALAPPVKGSYPVAGNGPNVLDEIQRTRAKRQSQAGSIAPNTSRRRDDIPKIPVPTRPQTAPHTGGPGGGHAHGRTRSGFSMKSPPSFFSPMRKNPLDRNSLKISLQPPIYQDIPPVSTPTPPPQVSSPLFTRGRGREPAYQPLGNDPIPEGFTPPFAHIRSQSQSSHRSHVDLLDAHSTIKNSREHSQHRAKASGFRNYGEDVADRNIAAFSSEHRMDLNSPEFGYLRKVYNSHIVSNIGRSSPGRESPIRYRPGRDSPARESVGRESPVISRDDPARDSITIGTATHIKESFVTMPGVVSRSRPDSAAGRVASNDTTSDDTTPPHSIAPTTSTKTTTSTTLTTTSTRVPPIRHLRTSSMRSNVSRLSQSRPSTAIPPRTDSATTRAYSANRGRNDAGSPSSNESYEQNARPMSPLSAASSIDHEPPIRNPRRLSLTSSIAGSTLGRTEKSVSFKDLPPVALPAQFRVASPTFPSTSSVRVASPSHSRQTSNTSATRGPSLASRQQRTASMPSQNSTVPQGHGNVGSTNNPSSYRPSPPSPKSSRLNANRKSYVVQRSSNSISVEGVVDLSRTVDTEVNTKSLPGTYKPSTSSPNRRSPSLRERRALSSSRAHIFSPLNISPHPSSRNSSQGSLPPENWPLPHSPPLTPSKKHKQDSC